MALIEIDDLPINSMVIVHCYVSHNQMVPSDKSTWQPYQIGGGRLVSTKNGDFSGSMLIYQGV